MSPLPSTSIFHMCSVSAPSDDDSDHDLADLVPEDDLDDNLDIVPAKGGKRKKSKDIPWYTPIEVSIPNFYDQIMCNYYEVTKVTCSRPLSSRTHILK